MSYFFVSLHWIRTQRLTVLFVKGDWILHYGKPDPIMKFACMNWFMPTDPLKTLTARANLQSNCFLTSRRLRTIQFKSVMAYDGPNRSSKARDQTSKSWDSANVPSIPD